MTLSQNLIQIDHFPAQKLLTFLNSQRYKIYRYGNLDDKYT